MILVGYSESSKAYKLYNLVTKKVVVSRDVIFDESKEWNEPLGEITKDHIQIINEEETTTQDNDNITYDSPPP